MTPLTYALCQKPVVGLFMFLTFACSFPPIFNGEPFPVQQANAILVKEFDVPVSKYYSILLNFRFPSAAAVYGDAIVGTGYDMNCEREYAEIPELFRKGLGVPIPVHVLIREKKTGIVKFDKLVNTLCITSSAGAGFEKTRTVARTELSTGTYTIEMRNIESQTGLDGVVTTVSLVSGDRK